MYLKATVTRKWFFWFLTIGPLLPPRKHSSLLPGCAGFGLNTLIYPSAQGEHPLRGDGDLTGVEASESYGNKAYSAGAKGEAGGAAQCQVLWTWPVRQECETKIIWPGSYVCEIIMPPLIFKCQLIQREDLTHQNIVCCTQGVMMFLHPSGCITMFSWMKINTQRWFFSNKNIEGNRRLNVPLSAFLLHS